MVTHFLAIFVTQPATVLVCEDGFVLVDSGLSHACVEQEQVPTFNFVAIIEVPKLLYMFINMLACSV